MKLEELNQMLQKVAIVKMERKEIKYLPFIIGYLGNSTYGEVANLMKKSEVETFNALEKLVKMGKINSKVLHGETIYFPNKINYEVAENE